jgi:hypothetical protein
MATGVNPVAGVKEPVPPGFGSGGQRLARLWRLGTASGKGPPVHHQSSSSGLA